jgi:hypothetical protein
MKTLHILDSSGDMAICFDDSAATLTERKRAQALFEKMLGKGARAFTMPRDSSLNRSVARFAELDDETIVVPRIFGG